MLDVSDLKEPVPRAVEPKRFPLRFDPMAGAQQPPFPIPGAGQQMDWPPRAARQPRRRVELAAPRHARRLPRRFE